MLTVLSLCDYTGEWSRPYREAGYDVRQVDLKHGGGDVRLFKALNHPVRGILAAPPCDHFAASGARWWEGKGEQAVLDGLAIVDACMRVVLTHNPIWWVLENPVGRLKDYLGEPRMSFDPADYGDPYTKKTLLWGVFKEPLMCPVEPVEGSKIHRMSSSWKTQRSATPSGFAEAFFKANP
jgi:hypothetical protein